MKKMRVLMLALLVVLCACSPKENRQPEVTASPEPLVTAAIAIVPVGTPEAPLDTKAPASIPSPSPSQEPAAEIERYCAAEGVYTVAWLSDTQHYANTFPAIYPVMTGFLHDHREEMHLAYIVHTGDLVHRNDSEENWLVARAAMDLIDDIPNGVLAGNHDMEPSTGGYENYWKYFGEDRYKTKSWYGGSFENNRCHYDLMTVGGRDYIFAYVSHAPDDKALAFAKEAFDAYPTRTGILCVHDFITTEGGLSEAGQRIREKVFAPCSNVYMVLCGHNYGLYCLTDAFDDNKDGSAERTVYELMMNYQAAGKEGGSGYLRLMQFDEEKGLITCINYSPYLKDYNWLDEEAHKEPRYEMDEKSESFVLSMPWK